MVVSSVGAIVDTVVGGSVVFKKVVVGIVVTVVVLVVCVGVVIVVVVVMLADLGKITPIAIIALMQTLANSMANTSDILGYVATNVFALVMTESFAFCGGFGGGIEGGGGNLFSSYLSSISLYKPS